MDFEEIYQQYAQMLYHYLFGLCHDSALAEDIVQTTFLKAIEKADSFQEKSKLSTWLFEIAKNQYRDYLRKKEHANISIEHLSQSEDGEPTGTKEMSDPKPSVLENMIEGEDAKQLRKYLHELPEPYKEVFMLRVYAECSYKEIGDMFGKSEVWGRVTYFRAREKLVERWMTEKKDKD